MFRFVQLVALALTISFLSAWLIGKAGAQSRLEFDPSNVFSSDPRPAAKEGDAAAGAVQSPHAPGVPQTASGTAPAIVWRVENGFRFFTDPDDTDLHRETYEALSPDDRRNPVLGSEQSLSRLYANGWAANLKGRVCWDAGRSLHVCPEGGDYVNPTGHTILARVDDLIDADVVRCTWKVTPVKQDLKASETTVPCHQAARVEVPYPEGGRVSVAVGGREIAAEDVTITDLLIVGVGDSFGSGEGNPDVPVQFDRERSADYGSITKDMSLAGYPARVGGWKVLGDVTFQNGNARWLDQACHRSLYSHQLRAALQLAIEDPHRSVTFLHLACSGAEITTGLFLRYKGHEWVPDPPALSQISAIAEAQCGPLNTREQRLPEAYHMKGKVPDLKGLLSLRECDREKSRKIDLMFVSIGGNDIGFARLVANAVLREETVLRRLGGWFGQIHDGRRASQQMSELSERYRAFKRALHYILHIPWNESDRVILTSYPALALLEDGKTTCPSGRAGMDVLPMFYLSRSQAEDSQKAADRLHRMMKAAATRMGWSFAQAHRDQFIGHGICAGYDGVSLSSADDLRFPRLVDGRWVPYNPADFRPYDSRQRWFRTPNDAFLTGHFHVAGSLLQQVLRNQNFVWTQVLLASTYSGAFHPTAEGHAAIADSVAQVARRVLETHGGGNRIK